MSEEVSPGHEGVVPRLTGLGGERLTLVDALDHLLNRGVVLIGETTISLADVNLVYVGLQLLVSSVETVQQGSRVDGDTGRPHPEDALPAQEAPEGSLRRGRGNLPSEGTPLADPGQRPAVKSVPSQVGADRRLALFFAHAISMAL